ncbi:MAG: response regulator transcription factor [Alphaproteobacteria bacterium]|jgi:two-component system phosphate regulon response regulator OmpR|nr:response regulator transcription factor [Alphaproteobacteria bacterium]MDP6590230.1 response regulator transcription factor [Alphaproteobacteria bacterium]MDP6817854.1 response regulator transcription factor [Alphaproteobacteria bacterium]
MNRDQAHKGSQSAPALDGDAPHIMVVDDDDRLRKLLRRYLSENGYRVTTAGTAAEAEARLRGLAFDLLVLDVMMPGESGVALTRRLRRHMSVPILLLTAMGEPEDRIAGLESGADDYLTKPFEPRELLLRIATILRRTRAVPPAAAAETPLRIGDFEFHPARGELMRDGESVRLTHTEAQLLTLFVSQPGVTLSREELCRHSGIDAGGRAIDVQITRLRRKIEPDPRAPRYLLTVWGEGYTLRPV